MAQNRPTWRFWNCLYLRHLGAAASAETRKGLRKTLRKMIARQNLSSNEGYGNLLESLGLCLEASSSGRLGSKPKMIASKRCTLFQVKLWHMNVYNSTYTFTCLFTYINLLCGRVKPATWFRFRRITIHWLNQVSLKAMRRNFPSPVRLVLVKNVSTSAHSRAISTNNQ